MHTGPPDGPARSAVSRTEPPIAEAVPLQHALGAVAVGGYAEACRIQELARRLWIDSRPVVGDVNVLDSVCYRPHRKLLPGWDEPTF